MESRTMNLLQTLVWCAFVSLPSFAHAASSVSPATGVVTSAETTHERSENLKLQQQKLDFLDTRIDMQNQRISDLGNYLKPAADSSGEVATGLKLQQQKLEFFDKRLDAQDKRIGDLALYLAAFAVLMTGIVIFFSLRSTREAVQAAKEEALKEIESWLKHKGQQDLLTKIDELLKPETAKALEEIRAKADLILQELTAAKEKAHQLNHTHEALIEKLASELASKKPSSPEEQKELEKSAKELEAKPPKEYQASDWMLLGIRAYQEEKYAVAADHFDKAAEVSSTPTAQAQALLNKGISLSQADNFKEAINCYGIIEEHFSKATEPSLREVVAKALVNKGHALGKTGDAEREIACYDSIEEHFSKATEPGLSGQVARALVNKGIALCQTGNYKGAIFCHDTVEERFASAAEPELRELVTNALSGRSFARLCEAKRLWLTGDEIAARALLELAKKDGEASLGLQPECYITLGNQGYILFLLGQPQEAEAFLAKALMLGGETLRKLELADAEIHRLPQDDDFIALIERLPLGDSHIPS
jgi:tetratricopeptide (TPR) repeat protein